MDNKGKGRHPTNSIEESKINSSQNLFTMKLLSNQLESKMLQEKNSISNIDRDITFLNEAK
jgi:hypothetical protein